jgi:hypothetical protein
MAGTKDDPFDWELDRVVQELCTPDRSWIPTPRARLPDPETLAEKLREGEYDGETLLATPEDDLWRDLGITNKAKFRVTLHHAITQFHSRSPKYRQYLASINKDQDAGSEVDTAEQPQAFTPMSEPSIEHPDEPPKKKAKRLEASAMSTTSRPLSVDQHFNIVPIPTELDTIRHSLVVKEAAPVSPQRQMTAALPDLDIDLSQWESSPGAYWGNGKLPRSGIIEAPATDTDDVDFGWGCPRPIGRAKKKYVADKLKAYLRRQKQDQVDDTNDILPLYGQSDDEEYGSELEKLIDEEEMEEVDADTTIGLGESEVDRILKQM